MKQNLQILLLISPAIIAGIVHSLVIKINSFRWLKKNLDFNRKIGGKPIFGKGKTFRGLIIMSLATMISSWLLFSYLKLALNLPFFQFLINPLDSLIFGFLFGLSYILGELPNSFIKRRLNIEPGKRPKGWIGLFHYLIDQVDSIISIVTIFFIAYKAPLYILWKIFIVGTTAHIVFDFFLHLFEIKKVDWKAENVSKKMIIVSQIVAYFSCKFIFKIYPGYKVISKATIDTKNVYIIASNHISKADPFIAPLSIPWLIFKNLLPIRFMVHDKFFDHYWQKIILLPLGCFPAKNNEKKTGLKLGLSFLENKQSVFIFPEGKIKKEKHDLTAKVGVAYLAVLSDCEILPILLKRNGRKIDIYLDGPLKLPTCNLNLEPIADDILKSIYKLDKI